MIRKRKNCKFCDVRREAVIECVDAPILYEVANNLHAQHVDDFILNHFHLECPEADMTEWNKMIEIIKILKVRLRLAL